MILVLSSSSPVASVALFQDDVLVAARNREARNAASGAILEMIDDLLGEASIGLSSIQGFVADVGPGSFTGVRVAMTLAKTFGLIQGKKVAGVSSFDLISDAGIVAFPSKKGEYWVRIPGASATRGDVVPEGAIGFGPWTAEQHYPLAANCRVSRFEWMDPEALAAGYGIEPAISQSKKPLSRMGGS